MTMALSSNIADYFTGRVRKSQHTQAIGVEQIPTYILDGVPQGWTWVTYMANFVEEEFEFIGVPGSLVNISTNNVAVTDVGGQQYSVNFTPSCTMSSNGKLELESWRIVREKMSPHMWRIVSVHRTGSLVS